MRTMTDKEINEFVDQIERLFLENCVARQYLQDHCNVSDPGQLLNERVAKIPATAPVRLLIRPVRQVIGQGLQDTQSFERLQQAAKEFAARIQDLSLSFPKSLLGDK